MESSEVRDFADYCVYEIVDGAVHYLCVCKEYDIAKNIAKTFAKLDPKCDEYYVGPVTKPDTLIPDGGWYDCWHKDKLTGKLVKHSLS